MASSFIVVSNEADTKQLQHPCVSMEMPICFLPLPHMHIHDIPMFSVSDWGFELEITASVMYLQFSFKKLLL